MAARSPILVGLASVAEEALYAGGRMGEKRKGVIWYSLTPRGLKMGWKERRRERRVLNWL